MFLEANLEVSIHKKRKISKYQKCTPTQRNKSIKTLKSKLKTQLNFSKSKKTRAQQHLSSPLGMN